MGYYSMELLGKDRKIPVKFKGAFIGNCNNIKKAEALVAWHISKRRGKA